MEKSSVSLNVKGIKPDAQYIGPMNSLVMGMICGAGLVGEFTLCIKTQSRSSGGGNPHIRIRNFDPTGVFLVLRASTENASKFDARINHSGMKAGELYGALLSSFSDSIYEPNVLKVVAPQVQEVLVTPITPIAPTTPIASEHSLIGFTRDIPGQISNTDLVLEAISESHHNSEFSKARFYDIFYKHKFCDQSASKKALSQILLWFLREGLIVPSGEHNGNKFFAMTEKAKIRVSKNVSMITVKVIDPVIPEVAPSAVLEKASDHLLGFDLDTVSVGLDKIVFQVKEIENKRKQLAELDGRIAWCDGRMAALKKEIDPVVNERDIAAYKAKGIRDELSKPEIVEIEAKLNRFREAITSLTNV